MNEAPQYPLGIEYRQPRPRGTLAGAALGSIIGYILTQNTSGTALGGTLGGILGNQPLPLPQAVRQEFTKKGLEVVSFYRLGRFAAKILFRYNDRYWTLESRAPRIPEMTIEQIEDWLYGDLVEKLETFLNQKDMRLRS